MPLMLVLVGVVVAVAAAAVSIFFQFFLYFPSILPDMDVIMAYHSKIA